MTRRKDDGANVPEPQRIILGEDLKRGLSSPQPSPTQADLDRLIAPATRVVVRELGAHAALIDSDRPSDLATLRAALRIREKHVGHCMCPGEEQVEFLRGDESLGIVSVHHGESLRWDPFFNNAELLDPARLLDWLSCHGWKKARARYDEAREDEREGRKQAARWKAAMPECLKPLWHKMGDPGGDWSELGAILARQYPIPAQRARVLFEWFGHGEGPWSGYPSYESVPEELLMAMSLPSLLEGVAGALQSEHGREGVARFFAGWTFGKQRRKDLKSLTGALKRLLLAHSLKSSDPDKRARAQYAFAEEAAE